MYLVYNRVLIATQTGKLIVTLYFPSDSYEF